MERLYDEAAARVMARYTYDGHDCLTPDGSAIGDGVGPLGPAAPTHQLLSHTVNAALVCYDADSPIMQTLHGLPCSCTDDRVLYLHLVSMAAQYGEGPLRPAAPSHKFLPHSANATICPL